MSIAFGNSLALERRKSEKADGSRRININIRINTYIFLL
jgi:hypothetical protein